MTQNTESRSLRYHALDTWNDQEILAALWESQADGVAAVRQALPGIAVAAAAAHRRLAGANGRLVYVGAGSSGRIAFQDGVELGPTFGWSNDRLLLLLAGGDTALRDAVEGAEDDAQAADAEMAAHAIGGADVVVGVAASGRTAYTLASLVSARARGALTIAVANAEGPMLQQAELAVLAHTGGEVIAGSTRLKAGTAQKIVLNLFSTLLMTRLGHVHDARMVDMRLSNDKLRHRAAEMVGDLAGCDTTTAAAALTAADGSIKLGVLIALGQPRQRAQDLLARHGGHLRAALAEATSS